MSHTHTTEAQILNNALANEDKDFILAYMLTYAQAKTLTECRTETIRDILKNNYEATKEIRAKAREGATDS